MKIKSKLIVGFGSLIGVIIIIGGLSYFFVSDLDRIVNEVGKEAQEAIALEEIRVGFLLQYAELDDYIETQNPRDIELYEEHEQDIIQNFHEAKQLAEDLGETENLLILIELEKEIEKIDKIDREIIRLVDEGKHQEAIDLELYTLEPEIEKVEELLKKEIHIEEAEFHAQIDQADEQTQLLTYLLISIIGSSVTFSLLLSFFISKSLFKPINKLITLTKEISEEKFDTLPDIKNKDEIGKLSRGLYEMGQKLKNGQKAKEEFVAMITHDLKQPLVPIQGNAEMLNMKDVGELNEMQQECVAEIRANASRQLSMIDNLVSAQKLGAGAMKFDIAVLSSRDILEECIKTHSPIMRDKKIEYFDSSTEDIKIKGDKRRILESFTNLVQNAHDFVPDNGKIEIGVKDGAKEVTFFVKDNGEGIPKNKQDKLFKKYGQVKSGARREFGGTGLGLAVSQELVNGMGGKIWLESWKRNYILFHNPKSRITFDMDYLGQVDLSTPPVYYH